MILNDSQIKALCHVETIDDRLLNPFVDHKVSEVDGTKVLSYGLSSFGYDIRLAPELKIFDHPFIHDHRDKCHTLDPHNVSSECLIEAKDMIIPENTSALGYSVEKFNMPKDLVGICIGKSTYARLGLIVNVTALEPGWRGILTLELTNTTPIPIQLYANEGIAQILFHRGSIPLNTYEGGKYQDQTGITEAKL